MAHLELQELYRSFGPVVALQGINLSLETGEFVSLLGPSGCGKTTALRLVAGFDRPDSGRVVVDGKDLTNVPPNRRDMGMVFQAYSLFPNMTAEQNVEYGLKIRRQGKTERRKRVSELLELVGLGHAGKRYAHQLSGGMQQRVALARALAIEPRVLLLDEPLSALDAKVRVQLREEIRRIQLELGITTLYVTHDQEEALSISDRVAVMYGGRIEQVGTPPRDVRQSGDALRRGVHRHDEPTGVDRGGRRVRRARRSQAPGRCRAGVAGRRARARSRPSRDGRDRRSGRAEPEPESAIVGEVVSHIFLGSVTRVRVEDPGAADGQGVTADIPPARAAATPVGTRVVASFPADSARLLSLAEQPVSVAVDPDDH